ncbi:RDD family protein [Ascidiimonas aurantiaca]|uniref:RDD family protein n=1 Tax=Ascidiimonas aurantiaca TaxID=1685432 RepID=UPI0030ECE2F4
MDKFQIETSQNVGIHQKVASIVDRMVAFLLDTVVLITYMIMIFWLLSSLNIDMEDAWVFYMVASLPAFLYYLLLETFTDGKTIGKYVAKIRVVKLDGSRPSFSSYFIRWMLRIIDVSLTSCGGAVLTILLSNKGQRLGDIAAGTTVISEKHIVSIQDTLHSDIPADYKPSYPQVTIFNDREIEEIKLMYKEALKHGDHHIVVRLGHRVEEVLGIKSEEKPMVFLQKVISDYNFYTQNM